MKIHRPRRDRRAVQVCRFDQVTETNGDRVLAFLTSIFFASAAVWLLGCTLGAVWRTT